jgi:hypothetical protein
MKQELFLNSGRYVIVAVYLIAAFAAILRPSKLGEAAIFAAVGFTSLAAANAIGATVLHLQIMAAMHAESVASLSRTFGVLSFVAQLLAVGGAVLVAVAVFAGRAKRDA